MSDRPTPETDAAKLNHSYGVVDIDFARKLERERDEARRQCLQWLEEWHLTDRVRCDMKSERDEARAERDILRLDAQKEAEHHDRMVGELEKLYAERDEARKERDQWENDFESMKKERDEWAALCGQYKQERDDAREMLKQYMFDRSGTWIDFLPADKPTP